MRLTLLAALFAAAAVATAAPQKTTDPAKNIDPKKEDPKKEDPKAKDAVEVKSKAGRFTATFPGKTFQQSQEVPIGDLKTTLEAEAVEVDGVAYMVMYCDYPKDAVAASTPKEILKNARDGALDGKAKLIDDEEGKFGPDKLPMREFTCKKEDFYFRNRIILDGNRMYQVMIVAKSEKDLTNAAAKKLYDTFELTKAKK